MTSSRLCSLLLPLALACARTSRLPRAEPRQAVLEVRGELRGGPFLLGEAELAALPQRAVQGVDPEGREARWEGVDLAATLSERVELAGGADAFLVRTRDGRAIAVPLPVVRELGPVLARRAGGAELPERVLAWPNTTRRGLLTDPRASLWWARGVVSLELVSLARAFGPALHVPEGAPPGALAGAGLFAARCLGCHQVRGAGGTAGPDLTRTAPPAGRLRALLPGHPGWTAGAEDADGGRGAEELAAFLGTAAITPEPQAP
jgi:mono/diheme cytochrome c family protein